MPQTASTMTTKLEKEGLEVFIGVEQVKASRQGNHVHLFPLNNFNSF